MARATGAVDYYRVLQVDSSACPEVVKAAHRALARMNHPDLTTDPAANARMAAINEAWAVLGDPERRSAYDRLRAIGQAPAEPAVVVASDGSASTNGPSSSRIAFGSFGGGVPRRPTRPSGTVLDFGRHAGESIQEIARTDPNYLEWLHETRMGMRYRAEIQEALQAAGYGPAREPEPAKQGRVFRGFARSRG